MVAGGGVPPAIPFHEILVVMTRSARALGRALLAVVLGVVAVAPTMAQDTPYVPDEATFGRNRDNYTLNFCVDPRDPAWQVDQQIGEAIAGALLIQAQVTVIKDPSTQSDLDEMYRHLLADCDIYFGFKLLADDYPDWLTITRPYYDVGYVMVAKDPAYKQLSDIPRDRPLGPTVGTTADFRLVQYLDSLPDDQRWPRYPMGDDRMALQSLADGETAAALVWAPSLAALAKTNPAFSELHVISSAPLPDATIPVGAVLLSKNTFLRSSVDQAIQSLVADGTIEKIITTNHFAAKLPQ